MKITRTILEEQLKLLQNHNGLLPAIRNYYTAYAPSAKPEELTLGLSKNGLGYEIGLYRKHDCYDKYICAIATCMTAKEVWFCIHGISLAASWYEAKAE